MHIPYGFNSKNDYHMKKILYILCISLISISFFACSDDDDKVVEELSVIEATTVFEAKGGTGSISLDNIGSGLSATSDVSWCVPAVSDNRITFTISENLDIEGRTALITIKSGNNEVLVPIIQTGLLLLISDKEVYAKYNEAAEFKISILKSNASYNVAADAEWIKFNVSNNVITINIDANTSSREGELTITSGTKVEKIKVVQGLCDFDELLGDWTLFYTNSSGARISRDVVLSTKENGTSYTLTSIPITGTITGDLTLSFDENKNNIVLNNSQFLNTSSSYYVYSHSWDPISGYYTWAADAPYISIYSIKEDGKHIITFEANEYSSNITVNGLLIYAWKTETPTSGQGAGSYAQMNYLELVKK